MVDPVTRIVATAMSSPTKIGTSTSICSQPDNVWVAARQSQINADKVAMQTSRRGQHEPEPGAIEDRDMRERSKDGEDNPTGDSEDPGDHLFSGESERIGCANFDDETAFGDRVAIV